MVEERIARQQGGQEERRSARQQGEPEERMIVRQQGGPEERRVARQAVGPLPCPRCGSNNTKFCYFNNYNTAQPRHFCRECHRYWTHGGALRNIPAPGEGTSRKNKRRISTSDPAAPEPNKVLRIQIEKLGANAAVVAGPVSATRELPPPPALSRPPPSFVFTEEVGLVGSAFSLRPSLSLLSQGILGGLGGFQPFNSLMMPPPPPPPPMSLFQGLNMHQVLTVNAGEGSSTGGVVNDIAGEVNSQDTSGGDLFVNQFFTRFDDGEGEETRAGFNAGADASHATNHKVSATTSVLTGTAKDPTPPSNFI